MPLKGEKVTVYAVEMNRGYGQRPDRLELTSAPGVWRGLTIALPSRPAMPGCRAVMYAADASLSPEDAITAFQRDRLAEIEAWRAKIAKAEAAIDASRALTPEPTDV